MLKTEKEIGRIKLQRKQSVISPVYRVKSAKRETSQKNSNLKKTIENSFATSKKINIRPITGKEKQPELSQNEEILSRLNNLFDKDKNIKKSVKGKMMNLMNKNVIMNFKEFNPEVIKYFYYNYFYYKYFN
jgi:hypothetical protein